MVRRSIIVASAALAVLLLLAPPASGDAGWTWPVRGRIATLYANDNARPYAGGMHRGIDIAADVGTAVVAARPGTVTYAGPLGSSGNVVAVRDGRYATSYLHLGAVSVSRGEQVAMGTRVGEVGTTGRRSVAEPHLHFGVRLAGAERRYVDPLSLLPAVGEASRVAPVPVPVPAGPVLRTEPARVRHPVVAPAAPRIPVAAQDRGRPLVLGGLALLGLMLFGSVLVRRSDAVNRRAVSCAESVRQWGRRASRPASRASAARPR
jgi:hypothetical protein